MRIPWEFLARLQTILAAIAVSLAAMMRLCAPPGALPDPDDPPKQIEEASVIEASWAHDLPVEQLRRVHNPGDVTPSWETVEGLLAIETERAEARALLELEAQLELADQIAAENAADWPVEQLRRVYPEVEGCRH